MPLAPRLACTTTPSASDPPNHSTSRTGIDDDTTNEPPAGTEAATALDPERFELLFGTPHGVDLTALAIAHGLPVMEAMDDESVEVAVRAALTAGGVHVVLARTDRAANVALHEQLHAATATAILAALDA